jgi:uncharacterized membrane protein
MGVPTAKIINNRIMIKKSIFILIWALTFYILSSIVFGVMIGAYIGFSESPQDAANKAIPIIITSTIISLLLFIFALFLGVKEKFPGTKQN